jgi:hypothetical protein
MMSAPAAWAPRRLSENRDRREKVEKRGKTCVSLRRIALLFNEDLRNVWPAYTAFAVDSLFSDGLLARLLHKLP